MLRHVLFEIGIDRKGRLFRPNEDMRRRPFYHETNVISTVLPRPILPLIVGDCIGWVPGQLETPDFALYAVLHSEVRRQRSGSETQLLIYSWRDR